MSIHCQLYSGDYINVVFLRFKRFHFLVRWCIITRCNVPVKIFKKTYFMISDVQVFFHCMIRDPYDFWCVLHPLSYISNELTKYDIGLNTIRSYISFEPVSKKLPNLSYVQCYNTDDLLENLMYPIDQEAWFSLLCQH